MATAAKKSAKTAAKKSVKRKSNPNATGRHGRSPTDYTKAENILPLLNKIAKGKKGSGKPLSVPELGETRYTFERALIDQGLAEVVKVPDAAGEGKTGRKKYWQLTKKGKEWRARMNKSSNAKSARAAEPTTSEAKAA